MPTTKPKSQALAKSNSKALAAILSLASTATTHLVAGAETGEDGVDARLSGRGRARPLDGHAVVERRRRRRLRNNSKRRRTADERERRLGPALPQDRDPPAGLFAQRHDAAAPAPAPAVAAVAAPGCGSTAGTIHSPFIGCYADRRRDRAFDFELYAGSAARNRGHGALDCERECSARDYRYFGREFRGQCFCGNDPLAEIGRHGRAEHCDCCGADVGTGRMCVWENANHPDSSAQLPSIPVMVPHYAQQVPITVDIHPMHSHLITSAPGINGNSIHSKQHSSGSINSKISSNINSNNHQHHVAFRKPTGTFRLRLHWQIGYFWQEKTREKFWCMQCRGSCGSGAKVQVDACDASARQKFIAVYDTLRPASNPALCLTVAGFGSRDRPIRLRPCGRAGTSPDQNFEGLRAEGRFELQPESGGGRYCLSQHHHPKEHEVVFPEDCNLTRKHDTTYWRTY